ncbi:ParM/StbA family protein [Orenia marismortui]|uniref:Plasmid segregation actin-type ATPase ParM n=1 Tax=Orenia marismortui TaxID=46469 RepID=A0A4V3GWU6_9FIRM|nr:ParM/StbA family protein [Orenia marismortui]TDX45399.1 plasmid segregation actin-type ATPase ParM [Orenia marismortui]
MKVFDVVGFDNGYDCVKIVVGPGEEDKVLFPSVTHQPDPVSNFSIFSISKISNNVTFNKEKMIIEYQGKEYYVGDYAVSQDARGGTKNFSDEKFQEPSEIVKFLAGISLFTDDDKIKINNLVLGLNVEKYNQYRDKMIKVFKDKTFEYKLSKSDKITQIEIKNVICVPQGIGAYYDQALTLEGSPSNDELANSRFGLIDIGGKTVDAFISEGMEPIVGTDIGIQYGMSNSFKNVAENLGDDIPYNLIAQNYLKGEESIFWKGKEYNVIENCKKGFNQFAQKVYDEITKTWDQQLYRTRSVLLCGGGARIVGDELSEMLPVEVNVLNNPQFSNANGYYKLGVYNSRKSRAAKSLKSKQVKDKRDKKNHA